MRTVILFFLTCIIATFAFFAALSMKNPWPGFIIAFAVWMLFIYRSTKR